MLINVFFKDSGGDMALVKERNYDKGLASLLGYFLSMGFQTHHSYWGSVENHWCIGWIENLSCASLRVGNLMYTVYVYTKRKFFNLIFLGWFIIWYYVIITKKTETFYLKPKKTT